MTQDQFTLGASSLIRHLLTVISGLLVARGFEAGGDLVSNLAAAIAVFGATLAWSFIQKNRLLSALVSGLNVSALEQLLAQAAELRRQGADPLLVAHMTGTALAVAQSELGSLHPTISAAPPGPSPEVAAAGVPAPAPVETPSPAGQEPDAGGSTL